MNVKGAKEKLKRYCASTEGPNFISRVKGDNLKVWLRELHACVRVEIDSINSWVHFNMLGAKASYKM